MAEICLIVNGKNLFINVLKPILRNTIILIWINGITTFSPMPQQRLIISP